MNAEKVSFNNKKGEKLVARVDLPLDQQPKAFVLFAHCFTCNKNLSAVRNISNALSQAGFGVLRFDFTGLGESEGDFADTNFSSNIQDLMEAAAFMATRYQAPKILVGHSLGGAAVLFAGQQMASVQAIATIGAPSATEHIEHLFQDHIEEIKNSGIANLSIGNRSFTIKKQFIEDIERQNMAHAGARVSRVP